MLTTKMQLGNTKSRTRVRHPSLPRLGLAVTASIVSVTVLSGLGLPTVPASAAPAIHLQMWIAGNDTTEPLYTAEAKAFSTVDPGVTVTLTDLPGPAYTQKLDPALAASKLPAIFEEYSPGPALRELVASKAILDLTSFVKANPVLKDRILPSAMAQGQVNGQQYGIPYNIFQEIVILYDKTDLNKAGISGPPKTWPDLMSDVSKLKAAGIIPISISGTETDNWYELWLENWEVRRYGLGVTDSLEEGKMSALSSPEVVAAAREMQTLVSDNAFEPGYSTTSEANDVPYALLGTGKAGMLLFGAFTPNFVDEAVPGFAASGKMEWSSFPSVPGGEDNDVVDLSSQPQLVVNAHMSKADIAAAEKFLAYFVYSPSQVAGLAKLGNVGPFAGSLNLVDKDAPAYLRSYMLFELSEAKTTSSFIDWSQLIPPAETTAWNELLLKLFTKAITPSQFGTDAAKL